LTTRADEAQALPDNMLNWADLMRLLIPLAGALGGFAGARGQKFDVFGCFLSGITGLAVGLGGGLISHKLAYSALRRRAQVLYIAIPVVIFFAVFGATTVLAYCVARL
jgi:hypothetical protein